MIDPADNGASTGLFLTPRRLVEFTRFFATEAAQGKYPYIDFDPEQRWHQRIYRDRRVDIWLISWLPTQGTQLHDHGGSSGSLTVLSGRLAESVVVGDRGGDSDGHPIGEPRLLDHERSAGDSIGFDGRYIHDVRNLTDTPAVSVHAYSPPLTSMNYYDVCEGRLERIATLATDDPEQELRARQAS